ncbi:hypothetical protein ACVW0P_003825 [Mucilaginibacter sp. UYNi724]
MSAILNFLKKKDLYLGIQRYLLGSVMIAYAIPKILKAQFVIIPFETWQTPLEHLSGKSLAWAFLGYSTWFEIMLGFFELIPAVLLLFRRTTLTGAILIFPLTLNVFLINMALNISHNTKVIALILLVLNILVLVFEWRKLWNAALVIIGKVKLKFTAAEIAINFIVIVVVGYMAVRGLSVYIKQRNFLTGDWINRHPNEWVLKSEKLGDSTLKARELKVYFGSYGSYSELDSAGKNGEQLTYRLNEKKKTLNFYTVGGNAVFYKGKYQLTGDTLLQIKKVIDSTQNTILTQVYKRRIINGDSE